MEKTEYDCVVSIESESDAFDLIDEIRKEET